MDLSLLPGLIYYLDKVKQAFFPLFFSDQGPELRVKTSLVPAVLLQVAQGIASKSLVLTL